MRKATKNTVEALAIALAIVSLLTLVNAIIARGPAQEHGPLAQLHELTDAPKGQAEQYPPTQQGVINSTRETATLTNIKITTQCRTDQGEPFMEISALADQKVAGETFFAITQAGEDLSPISLGDFGAGKYPVYFVYHLPAYTSPNSTSADATFDIHLGVGAEKIERIATIESICEAPPLSV